jgi:ATP-dependent Clp protease ATP-binding subunit ClpB
MTSNLAQDVIADQSQYLRSASSSDTIDMSGKGVIVTNDGEKSLSRQFINDRIYPILRRHFKRDEFLGRITEIMYFLPFTDIELKDIVSKELSRWATRVSHLSMRRISLLYV